MPVVVGQKMIGNTSSFCYSGGDDGDWAVGGTTHMEDGAAYKWLFDAVFIPLNATMFALLFLHRIGRIQDLSCTKCRGDGTVTRRLYRDARARQLGSRFPALVNIFLGFRIG